MPATFGDSFTRGLFGGSRQSQAAMESAANRQLQLRRLQAQITANEQQAAIQQRLQTLREKDFVSSDRRADAQEGRARQLFEQVTLPTGIGGLETQNLNNQTLGASLKNLQFMNALRERVSKKGVGGVSGDAALLGLGPSLLGLQGTREQIGALSDVRRAQALGTGQQGLQSFLINRYLISNPGALPQLLGLNPVTGGIGVLPPRTP